MSDNPEQQKHFFNSPIITALVGICTLIYIGVLLFGDLYHRHQSSSKDLKKQLTQIHDGLSGLPLLDGEPIRSVKTTGLEGVYEVATANGKFLFFPKLEQIVIGDSYSVTSGEETTSLFSTSPDLIHSLEWGDPSEDLNSSKTTSATELPEKVIPTKTSEPSSNLPITPVSTTDVPSAALQTLPMSQRKKLEEIMQNILNHKAHSSSYDVTQALPAGGDAVTTDASAMSDGVTHSGDAVTQSHASANSKQDQIEARYNLDGRVDPQQLKVTEKAIIYRGKELPKLSYDASGNPESPAKLQAKLKNMADKIFGFGPDWSIAYLAKNERKKVIAFIDPTCEYCRKFHTYISKLNNDGISVYYLWFPRNMARGLDNNLVRTSLQDMDDIWYNTNRKQALSDVMSGLHPEHVVTDISQFKIKTPVFEQYLLASLMGVTTTPAFLTDDGRLYQGVEEDYEKIKHDILGQAITSVSE